MTEREFEAPSVEEAILAIAAQLNRRNGLLSDYFGNVQPMSALPPKADIS
jgi:hypothetical protein